VAKDIKLPTEAAPEEIAALSNWLNKFRISLENGKQ